MSGMFFVLFLVILAVVWLSVSVGLKYFEAQRSKKVAGMLKTVSGGPHSQEEHAAVESHDRASQLAAAVSSWNVAKRLETRIAQAGMNWTLDKFLIVTLFFAAMGAVIGTQFRILIATVPSAIAFAVVMGALPYLTIERKRKKRFAEFEKQFPEALDFLSRSMRAGHAFSASLEMLAAETPAPLGPEFKRLYDEQNLGAPIEAALQNLAQRVPLLDVRFFVSAVLLQRRTGGNLGEILRNLARVIRERFQIKGHVKAMAAHGRLTAGVLTVLPLITVAGLMLLAPDYLTGMAKDPDGKYLIIAAVIAMLMGYYFMRRITNIKI